MNCPKCNEGFLCGCASCAPRHATKGLVCSKPEGEFDSCGHCGHRMHVEEWFDLSVKSYERLREKQDTNAQQASGSKE